MTAQESRSQREKMVEQTFLSSNPRVAQFPHVLVASGVETLGVISKCAQATLGLWGERPLFTEDASQYVEPPDGKILKDFALWRLAPNQKYLLDRATVGPDPSFRMFLSVDTPVEALSRTYEHFDEDDGAPFFGDYISYVCDWLPVLRWTLIPLEGEIGWSVFVAVQREGPLVASARTQLKEKKIPTAHLSLNNGLRVWTPD